MFVIVKKLTPIGNACGAVLPQSFLNNLGWSDSEEVALEYKKGQVIIRKPTEEELKNGKG